MYRINFLSIIAVILMAALPMAAHSAKKPKMGWVEYADIHPLNFRVKAKLDTGAKTSSMHALDIETFEREGETWVRFTFESKDYQTPDSKVDKVRQVTLERKRVRNVVIKRHKSEFQERPVVEMTLCIAGNLHTEQFSLIDRTRFLYPVLLGRRALKDMAVVDAGKTFLTTPDCPSEEKEDDEA